MATSLVQFEITNGLITNDSYHVQLKGFVEIEEENKSVIAAVETACRDLVRSMSLLDTLNLIKEEVAQKLVDPINSALDKNLVTRVEISTVDALEVEDEIIDIDIDPSLEKQSKKKGIFGKIKSLFGLN